MPARTPPHAPRSGPPPLRGLPSDGSRNRFPRGGGSVIVVAGAATGSEAGEGRRAPAASSRVEVIRRQRCEAMSQVNRRTFLKSATVAAAAVGVNAMGVSRVLGANEQLRVACAGIHGRGRDHIRGFNSQPNCSVVALCDVDENDLGKVANMTKRERGGAEIATYVDVRKLLEDKDIDILSIATPNHWHSLMAIWACQAGKDVYVEKPS